MLKQTGGFVRSQLNASYLHVREHAHGHMALIVLEKRHVGTRCDQHTESFHCLPFPTPLKNS